MEHFHVCVTQAEAVIGVIGFVLGYLLAGRRQ